MYARRLLIHSMANMRELGGYETVDGHMTQYGRFIRSDGPTALTEEDIAYLVTYGVRMVVDLRSRPEVDAAPNPFAAIPGVAYHNISFSDEDMLIKNINFCPRDHYVPIMKGNNRLKEVLACMVKSSGAVLFHCTAGKDRTGITAAMLLLLGGVPVEDVIADYQVTFTYIKKNFLKYIGDNPNLEGTIIDLCRSNPEWLEPLLELVMEKGGIETFLADLGVSREDMARLKARLLAVEMPA